MSRSLGIWIDHRHAVLVHVLPSGEEIEEIESGVEKHVREAGGSGSKSSYGAQNSAAGDNQDRKFLQHLNRFYDEVIEKCISPDKVLVFGPGEAKIELEKRVREKKLRDKFVAFETADKMTNPQIAQKTRNYFAAK